MKKCIPFLTALLLMSGCKNDTTDIAASGAPPKAHAAAEIPLPTKSQFSTVSQIIGTSEVRISYYRPNVNARAIWGNVVKWDTIWRTGAEKATIVHFDDDVMVSGKRLAKGNYSFFIIPRKDRSWTLVFNKNSALYGVSGYKSNEDAVRFDAKPQDAAFTETMTFDIINVTDNSASISLSWADKRVSFPIVIDKKITWDKMDKFLKDNESAPDSLKWGNYMAIANYCVYTGDNEKASYCQKLIDKSLAIKKTFENLKLKSDIYALEGKYDSASVYAKQAHKLGSTTRMPIEIANLLEENIKRYESLKK